MIMNGLISEIPSGSRMMYRTTSKGLELNLKFQRLQTEIDTLRACLLDAET